jgi:hypothetical protein
MTDFLRAVTTVAGGNPPVLARLFPRHFFLETKTISGVRRAISAHLGQYALGVLPQGVTVTRAGTFWDPRYGEFDITPAMLAEMVRNFDARTYGQDVFIDISHKPQNGSAGKINRLWVEGDRLLADVDWTPYGREAIAGRGYQYLSAEFDEDYVDNEKRQHHGATLFGAALTIRPVIKHLDPIRLSEPTGLHRALAAQLIDEAKLRMNKHLQALLKRLAEYKLAQKVIDQLGEAFTAAAKTLGEDDAALSDLANRLAETGKTLAETLGERPATISLSIQPTATLEQIKEVKTLTEDDVRKLLAAERQRDADAAAANARSLAERRDQFAALIDKSESIKALAEPTRVKLLQVDDLITAATTPAQVESVAAHVIALAEQMAVASKLAALGWGAIGSTRISVAGDHAPLKLQERIDSALKNSIAFGNRGLRLKADKDLSPAARRVLAEFDRCNAPALAQEAKRLDEMARHAEDPATRYLAALGDRGAFLLADGGATTVGNINVPVGFQRTVIREALSDLNVLDLVQVLTDPSAQATTQIPYELRKAGTVVNDGIVFEGNGIPRASIEQKMDTAYVNKMALSLLISNEVAFFSRSALIDWDAYGRNVESNARLMRELVARRVANEMQRAADAYGSTVRTAENIASQLAGSSSLIKTTYWPIVRPKQIRDLQGNAIGSAANPITLVLNTVTLSEYDGTGTQAAGTYWRVESYNLGLIRLVNQAGVAQTPTASTTTTITYSSANNVSKFDLKLPSGVALEDHLNGALRSIGARKAIMSTDRYVMPDFQLMSPVLNDILTNARQFTESGMTAGATLTGVGDLATVKGIPAFGTNAPGIDLGDDRILLGQRGTLSYVVVKPFLTGIPFEAVNSSGQPTGERIAYGEEYNAVTVPTPIQNRLTSVIVYDSDARTAAA